MLLKLRRITSSAGQESFRSGHSTTRCSATARRLLAAPSADARRRPWRRDRITRMSRRCPLYEYQCDRGGTASRRSEVFRSAVETCPKCGGHVHKLIRRRVSAQGQRLVHHRLRAQGFVGSGKARQSKEPGRIRKESTSESRGRVPTSRQQQGTKSDRNRNQVRRATKERRRRRRPLIIRQRAARRRRDYLRGRCDRHADARVRYSENFSARVRPPQREVDHRFRNPSLLPVSWRTPFTSQA
jgi:hypothetical protein